MNEKRICIKSQTEQDTLKLIKFFEDCGFIVKSTVLPKCGYFILFSNKISLVPYHDCWHSEWKYEIINFSEDFDPVKVAMVTTRLLGLKK